MLRLSSSAIKEIEETYLLKKEEVDRYLNGLWSLKETKGTGFQVLYGWFFSVPQKWTTVEPCIFGLHEVLGDFEIQTLFTSDATTTAEALRPIWICNAVTRSLKNFVGAIKKQYHGWEEFKDRLARQGVARVFEDLRSFSGTRLTYKNLCAIELATNEDETMPLLDRHIGRAVGIDPKMMEAAKKDSLAFQDLMSEFSSVTAALREKGDVYLSTSRWNLSVWSLRSGIGLHTLLGE